MSELEPEWVRIWLEYRDQIGEALSTSHAMEEFHKDMYHVFSESKVPVGKALEVANARFDSFVEHIDLELQDRVFSSVMFRAVREDIRDRPVKLMGRVVECYILALPQHLYNQMFPLYDLIVEGEQRREADQPH